MKFYFSHAIRGKAGPDASHDVQATNCAEAIRVANILRAMFRKIVFYVPAENETFVQIAYDSGRLSETEILDVDCRIIDECDGVLIYKPENDELQGGRKIEYEHAIATHKPVVIFNNVHQAADWIYAQYGRELI